MFPKSHAVIPRRTNYLAKRLAQLFSRGDLLYATRAIWPTLLALTFAHVAHAQGTMDFSGATTLMQTFKAVRVGLFVLGNDEPLLEIVPEGKSSISGPNQANSSARSLKVASRIGHPGCHFER